MDRIYVKDISYAGDLVLLSLSISVLRTLEAICGQYAERYGIRYNISKSEMLTFDAKGTVLYNHIQLNVTALQRITEF